MKCYAVTHGEYSDYEVLCVFEEEDDAKKYAKAMNDAYYERNKDWVDKYYKQWNGEFIVEALDFYQTGVVPIATR